MSNQAVLSDAEQLTVPSAIVEMFVLDASAIGGQVLRFVSGNNANHTDITWQGTPIPRCPASALGSEHKAQGTFPRPTVRFSNVLGAFSALCIEFDDLVGATFTRKRTFAKYLDGQPDADPTAAFPDEVFEVDRKSLENRNTVEFELASAMDVEGVMLPRRQVLAATCAWRYRGPECGFAGNFVVADADDKPIPFANLSHWEGQWVAGIGYSEGSVVYAFLQPDQRAVYFAKGAVPPNTPPPNPNYWTPDQCSLTYQGCKLRFSTDPLGLPFGGFPGTDRTS